MSFFDQLANGYSGYAQYLWGEITFGYDYKPWWENYFYGLILISLIFFALERARPWRKDQPRFRKDFWLDAFYMFFNFFLFSLIVYNAASYVVVNAFDDGVLQLTGVDLSSTNPMRHWPRGAILLTGFVVSDFLQWNIHRLLHRVPALWEFHKVHHSVEQMGFAAHLRYHWMETIVYKSLQYIPLALMGIGLHDFFIIHLLSLTVGHFNHSNFRVDVGWLGYVLNNPRMHIWHHSRKFPNHHPYGVNYGITLSLWDYLFGTAWIPGDGRDIELGFPELESFPKRFVGQISYGFRRRKK